MCRGLVSLQEKVSCHYDCDSHTLCRWSETVTGYWVHCDFNVWGMQDVYLATSCSDSCTRCCWWVDGSCVGQLFSRINHAELTAEFRRLCFTLNLNKGTRWVLASAEVYRSEGQCQGSVICVQEKKTIAIYHVYLNVALCWHSGGVLWWKCSRKEVTPAQLLPKALAVANHMCNSVYMVITF